MLLLGLFPVLVFVSPFGNLRQAVDEGGQTKTLLYDALNRPTQAQITGGAGGSQTLVTFHDGADRRTAEETTQGLGGASLHRYDALGRQTAQEDFNSSGTTLTPFRTLATTYTDAGDRLSAASDHPGIGSWAYEHDEDHLIKKIYK